MRAGVVISVAAEAGLATSAEPHVTMPVHPAGASGEWQGAWPSERCDGEWQGAPPSVVSGGLSHESAAWSGFCEPGIDIPGIVEERWLSAPIAPLVSPKPAAWSTQAFPLPTSTNCRRRRLATMAVKRRSWRMDPESDS